MIELRCSPWYGISIISYYIHMNESYSGGNKTEAVEETSARFNKIIAEAKGIADTIKRSVFYQEAALSLMGDHLTAEAIKMAHLAGLESTVAGHQAAKSIVESRETEGGLLALRDNVKESAPNTTQATLLKMVDKKLEEFK